jgi:uncharacterized protein YbaR (Trm112 family)
LKILCCPETRQALSWADSRLLDTVNSRIRAGQQTNRVGQPVNDPVRQGLLRADHRVLYPVRDGIPILLVDEGLPLAPL